jgi:hypothetical protein
MNYAMSDGLIVGGTVQLRKQMVGTVDKLLPAIKWSHFF